MAGRSLVQRQEWRDLLFAHWPLKPGQLRKLIPEQLEIDCFEGQAWVGIVPFRMTGVRLRWLPSLPWVSAFPELNLRTYVRYRGQPGVYFLSLDATNPLAVLVARRWYHLPYHRADIDLEYLGDRIRYACRRRQADAAPADLTVEYRPLGDCRVADPGSIEHFLVERYALFCTDREGGVLTCRVQHQPWQLQSAEAEFQSNTLASAAGIELPNTEPLLWFSELQATWLSAPSNQTECHIFANEASPELRATLTRPASAST
ncbi:MAG: YqjF family protein [Planctomycetota bacterium]|jgi:uncharacterized protein YqjF (DUF2071 family)